MKRFFPLVLAVSFAFSGCGKAPVVAAAKSDPGVPTVAKDGPQPVPTVPAAFTPDTHSLVSPEDVPLLEQINRENARVVAAALPGIVRVVASRPIDPHLALFGREFSFQIPFGQGDRTHPMDTSYGSGVIIGKDGYILTNSHVIEDARDVEVQLDDKRSFPARIVASDDMVDIAVLKINATGLPALPWGDSDKVQVGEQVFAIGNPFDLEDSVSKGIVSAKSRSLPDTNTYEDYIQTDAAINPGNSGGALVNIYGQLVGVNAAIASTSRVNMGVGFAIPSNLVRFAVEGLLKEGKLVRGYLGVILPASIDDGVTRQLGLKTDRGALLAGVLPGSPAEKAGLQSGDFITGIDDRKIDSIASLRLVVAQLPIGKEVAVKYVRSGTIQSATIKIAEVPQQLQMASGTEQQGDQIPTAPDNTPPSAENVLGGLQVTDLNDKTRQKYGVDKTVSSGVVITGVEKDSVAEARGLDRGDVIESASINRGSSQVVASATDFANLAKNLKTDQSVVLLVHHDKASSFIFLAPEK